jgi:dephospho-CoA kinase
MATTSHQLPTPSADLSPLKGKILLVGLTGGIGSGKTMVSQQLASYGAGIIDTDLIAHHITAASGLALSRIKAEFGDDYIDPAGALDRKKMRELVFSKPQARQLLQEITHPLIRKEAIEHALSLAKSGEVPYLVFSVPLLIESGIWMETIDYLVVVDCPPETQISRVMQRSNLSEKDAQNILDAQTSRSARLAKADFIVENNASVDQLEQNVLGLHKKLQKLANDLSSSA